MATKKETVSTNLLDVLMTAGDEVRGTVNIPRLGLDIELKAMHVRDANALRARCIYPGKNGKKELNEEEFNAEMLKATVVGPAELFDEKLAKHYGAKHVGEVLDAILLTGELQAVTVKLQELNGISDEDVQSAKN